MITWIRLPSLPIWYFKEKSIEKIGALIGKVLKLDYSTKVACKGRFARASVEIDLTKPLVGVIFVEGREHKVEYEGLDLICFKCGRYSHKQDCCSTGMENTTAAAATQSQIQPTIEQIAARISQELVVKHNMPPQAVAPEKIRVMDGCPKQFTARPTTTGKP